MKRWLGIALLVVLGVAALVFLFGKRHSTTPNAPETPTPASSKTTGVSPSKTESSSASDARITVAERLLPRNTLLYFRVPNMPRLREQMQTLDLFKLWQEPPIQALLQAPMKEIRDNVAQDRDAEKGWEQLQRLIESLPGEAYFALYDFDPQARREYPISIVISCDGGEKATEIEQRLVDFVETMTNQRIQPPLNDTSEGIHYRLRDTPRNGPRVCTTRFGGKLFLTSSEDVMKELILRHKGRMPLGLAGKPVATLAENTDFQKAVENAPQDHVMFAYADTHQLARALTRLLRVRNEELVKQLESMKSLVWTTSVANGRMADWLWVSLPETERGNLGASFLPLQHRLIAATTPETSMYVAQSWDISRQFNQIAQQIAAAVKSVPIPALADLPLPDPKAGMEKLSKTIKDEALDVQKDLVAHLGNEWVLLMDKPQMFIPQMAMVMEVRNADGVKKFLDELFEEQLKPAETVAANATRITSEPFADGTIYRIKAAIDNPLLAATASPNVYVGKNALIVSISESHTRNLIERLKGDHFTVQDRPGFRAATARVPEGASSLMYFDFRDLIQTYYPIAQMMLAAQAADRRGEAFDPLKMPTAEMLTKRFTPIVMGQSFNKDGAVLLLESPVGLPMIFLAPFAAEYISSRAAQRDLPRFP